MTENQSRTDLRSDGPGEDGEMEMTGVGGGGGGWVSLTHLITVHRNHDLRCGNITPAYGCSGSSDTETKQAAGIPTVASESSVLSRIADRKQTSPVFLFFF